MAQAFLDVQPHSLEAEQTVLGALLVDPDAMIKVSDLLTPDDFYDPTYRMVFDAIRELYQGHQPIDIVTVSNKLADNKKLQSVGGRNFGYGHPHYPPLRAMRHLGIAAVVAESFSPGFWRGEISMGFPLVPCAGILAAVHRWDEVSVDWAAGRVVNHANGRELACAPLALADRSMLEFGGLTGYLKHRAAHPGAA